MSRPTRLVIDTKALLHNLQTVKQLAPGKKIIAMVKANAYGCGLNRVIPVFDGEVDAFGVACIEEGLKVRALGSSSEVVLFQGIFSADELDLAMQHQFTCVLHHPLQVDWVLGNPLAHPLKIWIKVNTGMNRLGFFPDQLPSIMSRLKACPWIDHSKIGLLTHLACADEVDNPANQAQAEVFAQIPKSGFYELSMANSAAILKFPSMHQDVLRPGIMLYGVSPFAGMTAKDLGLKPVMHFFSAISAIHHYKAQSSIGYGATWSTQRDSVIGIVAAGYGDGYPRHIGENTCVAIKGQKFPVVGRVSMDMMAVDLTDCPDCDVGDEVELWGSHIPVEQVAENAKTIGYELLCQIAERVKR